MYFVYDYDHFIKPFLEKPVPAGQNRLFLSLDCAYKTVCEHPNRASSVPEGNVLTTDPGESLRYFSLIILYMRTEPQKTC